jgi:serine/threonine protein phosphatase PrpC
MAPDNLPHPLGRTLKLHMAGASDSTRNRRLTFDWGGLSQAGSQRDGNEDSFFLGRFDRTLEPILTNLQRPPATEPHRTAGYVVMMADGMGGQAAGEVASQATVATLLELAIETPDWIMRYDEEPLAAEVSRRIASRLQRVDSALETMGRSRLKLAGMSTTITVLATVPPDAIIAHVGNSRVYLARAGELFRLTTDNTVAQLLAEAGIIDPKDVATHPKRDVLVRAVGHGAGDLEPDVQRLRFEAGDQILLCTDGLTQKLSDAELREVLSGMQSPATACKQLVAMALERGAPDDLTVVIGRLSEKTTVL